MATTTARAKTEWRRKRAAIVRQILAPPPKLTVSQWADRYRVVPPPSPEPGKWRTDRVPYLRGIMDAFSDPAFETVLCFTSAQIGKTEALLNVIGFHMDQDPAAVLVVYPDLGVAADWSVTRLAPMIRATPKIRDRVHDPRSRDSGNKILHKLFTGGEIKVAGANAPASLAGKPVRIVLCDEIDRFTPSSGAEGDPISLARKRTANFWNRKIGLFTTPTNKGFSRGETAWEESDQRRYHVPCPHCGVFQILEWGAIEWDKGHPETVHLVCMKPDGCGAVIAEREKPEMLARGRWVAENPGSRTAGFHLSALYSPWARWEELVREFLAAQGHAELLKVFVNTVLGELWEEAGERVDSGMLFTRLEPYAAAVPSGACVLTAAVDVQGDRLEVRVWGWGPGEESWLIDGKSIPGDPGVADSKGPWAKLDTYLAQPWQHEDGATLGISCTFIDSGNGWHARNVYDFCRDRLTRKIFACKGSSQQGHPFLKAPTHSNAGRVNLFLVGTSTGKDSFASQLKIPKPGPGYVHLPDTTDREELEQLTSEKKVTRWTKGRKTTAWMPTRDDTHGLDCRIYAGGAFYSLGADTIRRLPELLARVRAAGAKKRDPDAPDAPKPEPSPAVKAALQAVQRRKQAINNWR